MNINKQINLLSFTYLACVAVLGLCLHACNVHGADVKLEWDVNTNDFVEAYNLYIRHDLQPNTNTINKNFAMPTPTPTNGWRLEKVIYSTNRTIVSITNTTFFTLTASNFLGESPFSQGVWFTTKPSTPKFTLISQQ